MATYTGIRRKITRGCVIGDSTVDVPTAAPTSATPIAEWIFTPEEITAGCTYRNLATGGDTIVGQTTKWNALTDQLSYDWVYAQIGLNDVFNSIATNLANYQTMVNTILGDIHPDAVLIIGTLIPVDGAFGAYTAEQRALYIQRDNLLREAIAGLGATPITGVHGRVTAYYDLLSDGSGALASEFETPSLNDHLHENDDARVLIVREIRKVLYPLIYV